MLPDPARAELRTWNLRFETPQAARLLDDRTRVATVRPGSRQPLSGPAEGAIEAAVRPQPCDGDPRHRAALPRAAGKDDAAAAPEREPLDAVREPVAEVEGRAAVARERPVERAVALEAGDGESGQPKVFAFARSAPFGLS
jgi:hypothetical protein